jgi:hypothetical protein
MTALAKDMNDRKQAGIYVDWVDGRMRQPLTWLRWASRMNFKVWPGLPITSCLRTGPGA